MNDLDQLEYISEIEAEVKALKENLAICHRQYQAEEDESTRLHEQYDSLRALVDELIPAIETYLDGDNGGYAEQLDIVLVGLKRIKGDT